MTEETNTNEEWGKVYDDVSGLLKQAYLAKPETSQRLQVLSKIERLIQETKGDMSENYQKPAETKIIKSTYKKLIEQKDFSRLADYIQALRNDKQLSLTDLAWELRVSAQSVHRWEKTGKIPIYRLLTIMRLYDPEAKKFESYFNSD